jgi:hypothetical protein
MPRPTFDSLPLRPSDPPCSAWGLYGPDDQLGTLNLLTSEAVTEAAKEIRTGTRVGLNLPFNYLAEPTHGRRGLKHTVLPSKGTIAIHDDLIELNTQVSLRLFRNMRKAGLNWEAKLMSNSVLDSVGWIPSRWVSEVGSFLQWGY